MPHDELRNEFERLIKDDRGSLREALSSLDQSPELETSKNQHLVKGILSFLSGKFSIASQHFEAELARDPCNRLAQDLLMSLPRDESSKPKDYACGILGMYFKRDTVRSLANTIEIIKMESSSNAFPKISLVTPSFNQAEYLEQCIQSVLSQGYPNLEYIIMDGGSTDGSVDIIKRYEDQLFYWQSQADGGHYRAIEAGFQLSTGEIMGWINSDDRLHDRGLFNIAAGFAESPEVRLLTGRNCRFNDRGDLITHVYPHVPWCRDRLLSELNFENPVFCVMQEGTYWRRSLWQEAGGYLDCELELAADFELWARFMRYDRMYPLNAKTGGFRDHGKEQKSKRQWE
ncbi:MAG: glycosyltransferase, partial [Bdellovibrionales bacterium]|nr:glycosyltransferase [Bdellovibrionales bacterium]